MRTGTDAVTPVISALIMIGMTFVLTAAIFLVVNGLRHSNAADRAPLVVPTKDEQADRLTIIRADPGVLLANLRLEMSVPGHFAYNSFASQATTPLPTASLVPLGPTGTLAGGDTIYFCADQPASNVQVLLQDPITNRVVASDTFVTLGRCA